MTVHYVIPTLPIVSRCDWCQEVRDVNHPLCDAALRNLALGYCAECGEGVGPDDEAHEACIYAQAAKAGRPDVLEPPSPEDTACLERLVRAIESECLQIEDEGDEWWRKQAAPWN